MSSSRSRVALVHPCEHGLERIDGLLLGDILVYKFDSPKPVVKRGLVLSTEKL